MLTLIPTPIGNLEDITLRAIRVLKESDIIACEDTRTSKILLNHYGIDKPLTSFHLHNENDKVDFLLEKLRNGENVAVISDAGTPGISDPGWILLKRAVDEGLKVDVLPGASAVIPAVLLSGIKPQPFIFLGFPPEKLNDRKKLFMSIKDFEFTLCFYVSPHKIEKHISEMIEILGDRDSSLVREISKVFQEVIRGKLSDILLRVNEGLKGEFVLVVDGNEEKTNDEWKIEAEKLLNDGMSVKDIVKKFDGIVSRNEVKKFIMSHKK